MNQDLQHLKLLSIFHYVVGGLMALIACLPIIHLVVGLVMVFAPSKMAGNGEGPPPQAIGWLFVFLAGGSILLGWAGAICLLLAGWFLRSCKHYLFCMVVAGFACLFQPFGTVLGIFTIIVLIRPSVKQLFEAGGLADEPNDEDAPRFADDHITHGSYNIRSES